MCSWYEASATATKGETCADHMTGSLQAHKDVLQFLSQARDALRSLRRDCTALYVQCLWVYCLNFSSIFWNSFQETEITTNYPVVP